MSQVLMLESTVANSRSQPRGYTSQQQWEARRSEITRLYANQNVTLKEVIEIMKTSYSFFATKAIQEADTTMGTRKESEDQGMDFIVEKGKKRKLEEGKDTAFFVRDRPVDPRKISRFINGHDIPDARSQMSPTPSVISYHTISSGMPSVIFAAENSALRSNNSPGHIDSAISEVSENASEVQMYLPESTHIASMPAAVMAEEAINSKGHLGSNFTNSKVSFVNKSRSKASTGGTTALKEFFDFSAAAKTDGRSTSSIRRLTPLGDRPHSKGVHSSRRGQELTSDTESESTVLENLDSLIELAGTVEDQGRYEWSRVLLQRVVRLHRQRFGNKHPSTFGALEALSRILRRQGRYSEADQLLVGALNAFSNTGGSRSPETLLCLGLLALAKLELGLHRQVTDLARNALEIGQQCLDPKDPVLTRIKENLGLVLSLQGHHEAAEKIHREVLATKLETLGEEHRKALSSMHDLAICLKGQKKYEAMESMYRSMVTIESRTLGSQHHLTLDSMHAVASALGGQKRFVEAESMYREIISIRREVSGAEHPHTLTGTNDLAGILRDQGKHEEARALYNPLLEIEERTIGPEHPWTLTTQANLVSVLESLGEDDEAEVLSRRTLEVRERVLGGEHTSTLASKNQLARLLEDRGEYGEALRLYGDVLGVRRKVLGDGHELSVSMKGCVERVERAIREDVESVYSD